MRYIGILMMAGALAAGGFWAADQWKEKLELLLLFRQMIIFSGMLFIIAMQLLWQNLQGFSEEKQIWRNIMRKQYGQRNTGMQCLWKNFC